MELYETVRLRVDLPAVGLKAGAVGVVVHVFEKPNSAYEVEFTDEDGRTVGQMPLTLDQIESAAS